MEPGSRDDGVSGVSAVFCGVERLRWRNRCRRGAPGLGRWAVPAGLGRRAVGSGARAGGSGQRRGEGRGHVVDAPGGLLRRRYQRSAVARPERGHRDVHARERLRGFPRELRLNCPAPAHHGPRRGRAPLQRGAGGPVRVPERAEPPVPHRGRCGGGRGRRTVREREPGVQGPVVRVLGPRHGGSQRGRVPAAPADWGRPRPGDARLHPVPAQPVPHRHDRAAAAGGRGRVAPVHGATGDR